MPFMHSADIVKIWYIKICLNEKSVDKTRMYMNTVIKTFIYKINMIINVFRNMSLQGI